MLRITRNDVDAHRVVLVVQGHILAEWADLLDRECAELSRAGLRVALDLSGVGLIGRSGFDAITRLTRNGVAIIGCSPLVAAMLEQEGIAASREFGLPEDGVVGGNRETLGTPRPRR